MLALLPAAAGAEDMAPMAPAPQVTALAPPKPESDAEKLDALMAELAQPGRDDWQEIENKVERIWSKSGSAAMDLLLRRGNDAMAAEDYPGALEHLSALIEQAPDFAEGWNARATTYYLMGNIRSRSPMSSMCWRSIPGISALSPGLPRCWRIWASRIWRSRRSSRCRSSIRTGRTSTKP